MSDPTPITPHDQASAAFSAATHFVVTLGIGEQSTDEKIHDTLVGLHHLADEYGFDFPRLLTKAQQTYERDKTP